MLLFRAQVRTLFLGRSIMVRCFWLILLVSCVHTEDAPTVTTSMGQVVGSSKSTNTGTNYFAYEGIRYGIAKRFQEPEESPFSSQPTIAMISPLACPQWDPELSLVRGTEDCLYLSIFIPTTGFFEGNSSLTPIVLVIPGWHFVASAPTKPQQFIDRGIIVISVNYRLGVLGFFSTNDSAAAGNWGLLDLRLSLQWIEKNIRKFGGDPHRVTLMGHDSGGALVSYLLMDPMVKSMNMVVGAITMSGNGICSWALQENPLSHAHLIAQGLDCDSTSTTDLVECVRKASVEDLVLLERNIHQPYASFPLIAAPSIDIDLRPNPAVLSSVDHQLSSGNFSVVPLISGVAKEEGSHLFAELILQHWPEVLYQEPYFEEEFLPGVLRALGRFQENINEIMTLVNYHYFHESLKVDDSSSAVIHTIEMISDFVYNQCNRDWSKKYHKAAQVDVYVYKFEYHGRLSTMDYIINELKKYNRTEKIVENLQNVINHGDEVIYVLDDGILKDKDKDVEKTMTDLWADFIKHQKMPASWPSITESQYNYISIDGPSIKNQIENSDSNLQFLEYLYTLAKDKRIPYTEKYKASENVQSTSDSESSSTPHINHLAAIWSLAMICLALLIGMCFFIFLYINQRKKTTYITRSPVHRQQRIPVRD